MRRPFRRLLWLFTIYVLVCLSAAIFLANSTLHAYHRPLPPSAENNMAQIAAGLHSRLTDVQISAFDNATLQAWFIQPQHNNGDAVLLLHGLGDNRLGMQGYAELLLNHGYSVLMPDARAHGLSGGIYPTYGLLERDDIRRWFDWIQHQHHSECIFGFGESMGAAQLLQALDSEPNFCAVAAESSFSSFREIAYDRMGQQFHTGPWLGRTILRPVIEIALAYTRWKYHLDLASVSPENAVADTQVPVLLIHGQVDGNIPVRHSRRIKFANPRVMLWEVPGADHCGAMSVAPAELEQRVIGWFAVHQHVLHRAGLSLALVHHPALHHEVHFLQ
jgi:alpha-beta hydrolase superfamily lysophospholipase